MFENDEVAKSGGTGGEVRLAISSSLLIVNQKKPFFHPLILRDPTGAGAYNASGARRGAQEGDSGYPVPCWTAKGTETSTCS